MLKKAIPFHLAILMTFAGILGTFFLLSWINKKETAPVEEKVSSSNCNFTSMRLNGYQYIRPFLYGEKQCESDNLLPIKAQVEAVINSYKNSGVVSTASVYLRQLNQGDWFAIGSNEKYNPGSLLKVPELITFMKMNEKRPGLLDKKITYTQAFVFTKHANYVSKSIEVGKSYTIRELLYYMIAYSDNNATMLLNQQMDLGIFSQVFVDLGIPSPDLTKKDIPITAKEFSFFMRVLYNASYLNITDSEYCTELLSHSDFTMGMLSGLPKDLKIAHKFGEAGDSDSSYLSESGIIYVNNSPYLLTVMTKGKNPQALPSVIADVSKRVFELMNQI